MAAGAVIAASATPAVSARGGSAPADTDGGGAAQTTAPQDANDRSASRDPMAIHRSTIVVNGLDPSNLRTEYLGMLKAGGVSCWHRGGGNLSAFASALTFFDQHKDKIVPAMSVRDIRRAHQEGKISHVSGWQSADALIGEGGRLAIENLRAYRELGLRICGIAYNVANPFGAGCFEPHIGLTRAGRRLVEEIHRNRILLDVAGHTGEQTSLDALEMSTGMVVVCTHTNVRALTDNPRTTTDRVLEAIARTGGVIGLTAFNDFHARTRNDAHVPRTPQVGLEKHLDQYDYLKKLVGVDHIGLGPDFVDGPGRNDPGIPDPHRMPPEGYSQQPWFYVKGFENISELPNVTRGLIQRGWSTGEIRKVLGENWLRVYEKVWGGATS
jgi:membrane dipeptidase